MFTFLKRQKECTHPKVTPDKDACYCPDCGKYVENHWYLTRCNCCNIKRKTTVKFGQIMPESKYCPNCGAEQFYIEPVTNINFIDINFAVLIKEINEARSQNRTQSWLEQNNNEPLKLIGLNFKPI